METLKIQISLSYYIYPIYQIKYILFKINLQSIVITCKSTKGWEKGQRILVNMKGK